MGAEGAMYVNSGNAGRVARLARLAGLRQSTVRAYLDGRWTGSWAHMRLEEAMARLGWNVGGR